MILFKIDPKRLTLFPIKGDTPRSIYVDTVTFWYSKKAVEIKSWHIQIFQNVRLIQSFQASQAT